MYTRYIPLGVSAVFLFLLRNGEHRSIKKSDAWLSKNDSVKGVVFLLRLRPEKASYLSVLFINRSYSDFSFDIVRFYQLIRATSNLSNYGHMT